MINYLNYEEMIEKEGYIITGFVGVSMYPTFRKGDVLTILKCDGYNLYDIALYKTDNRYIAHRIIGIKDNLYIIRGDNTVNDEYVPKDKIIGKVTSLLRNNEEIEFNSNKNAIDYEKSLKTLEFRKLKNKLKKLIKYGR